MTEPRSDDELRRIINDPFTCFDDVHRLLAAELLELRAAVPTPWAYEQACKALEKHRARADQAERDRDDARAAIYVVQAAHERQLTRMAKERARLQRKVERLTAELEAAQRPPLGYAAGRCCATFVDPTDAVGRCLWCELPDGHVGKHHAEREQLLPTPIAGVMMAEPLLVDWADKVGHA